MDSPAVHTVSEFYDSLAEDFDAMTGFENRFVQERPFFRLLTHRFGITTAVDAGSGTGFHSLLLSQLGVKVTAVDASRKMIEVLRRHALERHLDIPSVVSDFEELPGKLHGEFDAVFVMGNTLAHLLSEEEVVTALEAFRKILRPGGLLLLQNLNYDRILASREKIQSIREHGGTTFVRYYEYEAALIQFHILKIQREPGSIQHELNTVALRPIPKDEIVALLARLGFREIKVHGGIALDEFRADSSRDLVVLALKG